MKPFVLALAANLLIASLFAQLPLATSPKTEGMDPLRLNRIDALVQQYFDSQWIAGATCIVARNGKVVYHRAFGVRSTATKVPQQKDDIFRIASQTKAITSTAVMMLFEEGKFLLDDPIAKYIPAFANQQVIDQFNMADTSFSTVKAKRAVTIRDLLTHTSGIGYAQIGSPRAKAMYAKAGVHAQIGVPAASLKEQVMKIAALPLEHQPGERFTYGLNTDVLGYFVEVMSGQSLADFCASEFLNHLA